jgi:hypothetical protein
MVRLQRFFIIGVLLSLVTPSIMAWQEDSRFGPFYNRYASRTWFHPSECFLDGFVMTGNDAFDHDDEDKDIGIFDTLGIFDENKEASAVVAVGLPDPFSFFPTLQKYQGQPIIWDMHGKIQTQGISLQWDQHIWRYLWIGGSCFFMHVYSRNDFELNMETIKRLVISVDDQLRLDDMRRLMNVMLGLRAPVYNKTGFSDIDFYIRGGNIWEYFCKCRRIDAGLRAGIIFPSGHARIIDNPSSIPFEGDGHWGVYTTFDFEIELKEDWKFGGHARLNKRFAKTKTERMPVVGEQQLFGAVQGDARINPGYTFIAAPYVRLENIRDGFGLQAGYTVAYHTKDSWTDKRPVQTPATMLEENDKKSQWTSEYVTVDAFYDCNRFVPGCPFDLMASFKWDIPLRLFCAKGSVKMNRVMLGVEFNY